MLRTPTGPAAHAVRARCMLAFGVAPLQWSPSSNQGKHYGAR